MKSVVRNLLLASAMATVSALPAGATSEAPKVFFMLPNTTTIRFEQRDAPFFVEAMKEKMPNATVTVANGQGDPARQQKEVEDAIVQGADLIVLISTDANLAAGSLKAAADAKVPVVLYEHDAKGGPAAASVVFDALAVGQAQGKRAAELIAGLGKDFVNIARVKGAQGEWGTGEYEKGQNEHLQPLIDAGKVKIVCEQYTPNWDQTIAQSFSEDCLTRTGGDVDMFLGMNDGTTGGAVAALISQGFKPGEKLVAGGQDADVQALQFIVQGWQDDTVFKDLRIQARAAADISVALLKGEPLPKDLMNTTFDNGGNVIPGASLPVEIITPSDVAKVVDAGVWSWKQVCEGSGGKGDCAGKE